MLAPARIPVAAGKKIAKTEKNVSPRKSGPMFSHMMEPEGKIEYTVYTVKKQLNMSKELKVKFSTF